MRWGGAGGGGTLSTPCKTQGEDESQRTEEISHCKPQFGLRSIMLAVPYANSERFEAAPVAHAIGTPPAERPLVDAVRRRNAGGQVPLTECAHGVEDECADG